MPAPGGLGDALRAIAATLGEFASVRGALFAVELREEAERRKQMLLLAALAFALLHTALLVLTFSVAAAFWDSHRLAALGAMAGIYLAFGAGALLRIRAMAGASPRPFAASLAELERDLESLRAPR